MEIPKDLFQEIVSLTVKERPNMHQEDIEHLTELASALDDLPDDQRMTILSSVDFISAILQKPGGETLMLSWTWILTMMGALKRAETEMPNLGQLINAPSTSTKQ